MTTNAAGIATIIYLRICSSKDCARNRVIWCLNSIAGHANGSPKMVLRTKRWITRFVAQDYARAVQLIEEIAEIEWDRARESRLLQWFKKLPDEKIDD